MRLTAEQLDEQARILAELLMRYIVLDSPVHYVDGKGPKHCPVCIWEDGAKLDEDHVKGSAPITGADGRRGTV
jgi:hypothetical protein